MTRHAARPAHTTRSHASIPGGVWSAAPTPFTHALAVDRTAVRRMVAHHLRLGGGVFNGFLARLILRACAAGRWAEAESLQRRMTRLMWAVYGGPGIRCWLAGEKYLLVRMGLFRTWANIPRYPLTASCRAAIARALVAERAVLMPEPGAAGP